MARANQKTPTRKKISPAVKQLVLAEAGHKCANPNCRATITLELHHIEWVKDGGGNVVANLLPLCGYCHGLHTQGHIPRESIETWKYLLESLNNPHRASADLLLVLYREEQEAQAKKAAQQAHAPFIFTGDSLGFLSGLLTSGLIEISSRAFNYGHMLGGHPYFEVTLTAKGRALMKAWLDGTRTGSTAALSMQVAPR
jgi:hypothetical protein